jgi:hypothetical protein
MPTPGPAPAGIAAALQALQKQVDRLARRPSGGGGAVLGRAGVAASFPTSMDQDTNYDTTDLYQYRDDGSSGVSVSGTVMTIQAGLYLVTCPAGFKAQGSSGSLEVHTGCAFNSPGVGRSTATSFGVHEGWAPGAAVFNLSTSATFTPTVAFASSVTGMTYAMFANEWDFEFVRLSA